MNIKKQAKTTKRRRKQHPKSRSRPRLVSTGTLESYNVLLINSNKEEAEFYSSLIHEVGTSVIDVKNQIDGSIGWINSSNYHLVVVDVSAILDKTNDRNLTTLEFIKRVSPTTSVIIISGSPNIEEAVSSIRLGAEDYLEKPFDPERFKMAVRRGYDRKTVFEKDNQASKFLKLLTNCQMISATLNEDKIFEILDSYLSSELGSRISGVYTFNGEDAFRENVGIGTPSQDEEMLEILDIALQSARPFNRMLQNKLEYLFVPKGRLTPGLFLFRFKFGTGKQYFYACLSPKKPDDGHFLEGHISMLSMQIEVTGRNIQEYKGVKSLIYRDDVTGLYNTRYLNEVLDNEVEHSNENSRPFAVLFIDLDHFKSVNDVHGHLVGSRLLIEVGKELKEHVRPTDKVFRYGGDEFVAVLPGANLISAREIAERIRASIANKVFLENTGQNICFTASIGVAIYPDHAGSGQEILRTADDVMYSAKAQRNMVYVAVAKPKVA